MTEDLNIDKNLKYLDDILKYLVQTSSDYSVNFNTLYKFKFDRDFDTDNKDFKMGMQKFLELDPNDIFDFSIADNTKAQAEKLYESLIFLNSKNLIRIDNSWNIKITFDGIIEIGKGGFQARIKEERYKNFLDSFNIYVTIVISLVSLLVGSLISCN